MLLQPLLGYPSRHRILAALSLVYQMESAASLAPPHIALVGLADPEHGVVAAREADVYGLSPSVGAGLRAPRRSLARVMAHDSRRCSAPPAEEA